MALAQCSFFSESLQTSVSMNVILPEGAKEQIGMGGSVKQGKYPCLYLLHGLSDDHSIWQRRTSIERYVAGRGLIVVMPNVSRSFYSDMVKGYKYWTFISEELPAVAASFFHISQKREDTFAAGLSMGGYGAFKLGLRCPEKFAAVASLSGALDLAVFTDGTAEGHSADDLKLVFGEGVNIRGSDDDLLALAEKKAAAGKDKLPQFYQCCGTEDFLYEQNLAFRDHAQKLGLNHVYDEGPGIHEWEFWDQEIPKVLEWLPIK